MRAREIKKEEKMLVENYYSESEMAAILGFKAATLKKNRSLGKGHPPFIKIGRRAVYPKKEAQNWLKAKEVKKEIHAD